LGLPWGVGIFGFYWIFPDLRGGVLSRRAPTSAGRSRPKANIHIFRNGAVNSNVGKQPHCCDPKRLEAQRITDERFAGLPNNKIALF